MTEKQPYLLHLSIFPVFGYSNYTFQIFQIMAKHGLNFVNFNHSTIKEKVDILGKF